MNLQDVLSAPASISKGIEEIILGPVTGEGANFAASVTNHAVESGINITDHVKNNPDTYSVKTILVDRDVSDYSSLSQVRRIIKDQFSVKEKIEKFKKWKENGEMLEYSGPMFSSLLKKGFDMMVSDVVITSIGLARADSAIEATISLQKVIIAKSMTKEIKLPQAAKSTQNKGQTEKGKTTVSESVLSKWDN